MKFTITCERQTSIAFLLATIVMLSLVLASTAYRTEGTDYPPRDCWCGLGFVPAYLSLSCEDYFLDNPDTGGRDYVGTRLKMPFRHSTKGTKCRACGWDSINTNDVEDEDDDLITDCNEEVWKLRKSYFCQLEPMCQESCSNALNRTFLTKPCVQDVQRMRCKHCEKARKSERATSEYYFQCGPTTTQSTTTPTTTTATTTTTTTTTPIPTTTTTTTTPIPTTTTTTTTTTTPIPTNTSPLLNIVRGALTTTNTMQCRCGNGTYPRLNPLSSGVVGPMCFENMSTTDYHLTDCDETNANCGILSCEVCGWDSAPAGSTDLTNSINARVIQTYCNVNPMCPTDDATNLCPAQQYRVQNCSNSDPDKSKWQRLACRWCDDLTDKNRFSAEFATACSYPPDLCFYGLGFTNVDINEQYCEDKHNPYGEYTGPRLKAGINASTLNMNASSHLISLPCAWLKPLVTAVGSDVSPKVQADRDYYLCSLPPMCAKSCDPGSFLLTSCVPNKQRSVCVKCSRASNLQLDSTQQDAYVAACVPTTTLPTTTHRGPIAAAIVEDTTLAPMGTGSASPVLMILLLLLLLLLLILLVVLLIMRFRRRGQDKGENKKSETRDPILGADGKGAADNGDLGGTELANGAGDGEVEDELVQLKQTRAVHATPTKGGNKNLKKKSFYNSSDLQWIDENVPPEHRV